MPASSGEVIGLALQQTYHHNNNNNNNNNNNTTTTTNLQEQLSVCAKQVLQNTVQYEHSGSQHTLILDRLKTKYVPLTTTTTTPTTNTTNTTTTQPMAHGVPKHTQGTKEDHLEDPHVVLWPRDKVTLGWRKSFHPGAGMVNLGNTCYLNSSLQALFHIPALANWLLEELQSHTQRCETNTTNASFCSVCAMMYTLRATLDRSANVIKPSLIQNKLKSIGKTLMYGRQEDAHEFIKLLLDHMEKSYLAFRRATKLDHRSKETTPLNQIFGGYLRQQVICPVCRYVSTTFNHFQDLVLDIRSVNSVDDALNLHFRKETLDPENAYRCERCHKKVPATKRHLIERPPHVLLIQLKRFTISGGKIGKHINIQQTIDLTRFINTNHKQAGGGGGGGVSSGPFQYRLTSMVIHIGGSQHGGHYTAVAESSSGSMYEFDDSSVRSISLQSALLRNPYILFYEMVRRPRTAQGIKQVVRQSSDKLLIKATQETIAKPFPTSHSASSVNGFPHAAQETNAGVVKGPLPQQSLVCLKERERLSFALKTHNNKPSSEASPIKQPGKLIIHSNTSLLATKPNTPATKPTTAANTKPSTPVKPAMTKITCTASNVKPQLKPNLKPGAKGAVSSLVPYADDTDESDDGKDTRHTKNPTKNASKGDKINPSKGDKIGTSSTSQISNGNASAGEGPKSKVLIPRTLQVVGSAVRPKNETAWQVTDAALHSPSEGSGCSVGSTGGKPFTVVEQSSAPRLDVDTNGWIVTRIKPDDTDRRQCEKSTEIRSSDAKLRTGSNDESNERTTNPESNVTETDSKRSSDPKAKDAAERGLTHNTNGKKTHDTEQNQVNQAERKPKPDLEKSLSNDCVLPHNRPVTKDSDTGSLRSRASVDSGRSGKSKRSIFSIFNCVSVRSPESPTQCDAKRVRDERSHSPSSPSKKACQDSTDDTRKATSVREAQPKTTSTSTTSKHEPLAQDSKNFHATQSDDKNQASDRVNGASKYESSSSSTTTTSSSSSLSESEEEDRWVERTKETIGQARAKHTPLNVVKWNDTTHKARKGLWEGAKSSNVVDDLRRAGNKAYGTEVSSWNGGRSFADQEFENARREAKKRSAEDLYNEEFDAGKSKKIKDKKSSFTWDGDTSTKISSNPFQRLQESKYNSCSSSSSSSSSSNVSTSTGSIHYNHHNTYYNNNNNNYNNNNNQNYKQRYSNWDRNSRSWGQNRRQKFHNKKYKEKYKH